MRFLAILPALFLLALTAVAPQAAATANGCALQSPGNAVPTPFLIAPPFPNTLGPACTAVPVTGPLAIPPTVTGKTFASGAPPCPPLPYIGGAPPAGSAEFCGPLVPAGTGIDCTATITGGPWNIDLADLRALVIGLDYIVPLTADGNVINALADFEPLRYDESPFPVVTLSVHIDNTLPVDARVIAYPIARQAVFVGCA